MFGRKKKNGGETVLILDVENGSVGVALSRMGAGAQPQLFGEVRLELPLLHTRDTAMLAREIEKQSHSALAHAASVASRFRQAEKSEFADFGDISRVAVFLNAPWGSPDLASGKPLLSPSMQTFFANEAGSVAPDANLSFYTGADAAAFGMRLFHAREPALLCVIRDEMLELLLMGEKGVEGYATVPVGSRTLLRTIRSHSGASAAEAQSLLALLLRDEEHDFEPLHVGGRHIVEQFEGAAQVLLAQGGGAGILVLGKDPLADWFARRLASYEPLSALFPQGGSVRALTPLYLKAQVASRSLSPDLFLMLDALFADAKLTPAA